MDYLGWELERQRAALAALLLGAGGTRDPVREEARRSFAETPGHYAGSSEEALGAWEMVLGGEAAWEAALGGEAAWEAGQEREAGGAGTPVSAWEAILGGETGAPASFGGRPWTPLSGETGAQPEFRRPSGGYPAQRNMRRAEAGLTAEIQGLPIRSAEDGAGDGAVPLEAGSSQDEAPGHTAAGRPGQSLNVRRRGGYGADTLGRDGPAVFQATEKAAGSVPWGNWETAALRAEDNARLLSRAIQRDARRYDGGFNIY